MKTNSLFTTHQLGSLTLNNRIAMAPMTRSRAINNLANDIIARYYAQRADAGFIITEGVSPSPNGLGYARIPAIYAKEQAESWKQVTKAVHEKGSKIFMQLMHTGRVSHIDNLPAGGRVLAPSAIKAKGQMWTDQNGLQDLPVPQEMTAEDILHTKKEFILAAINAIEAGFDGIELHAANGYLLEQFISPHSNQRTDNYGGSIENRTRFVLEVAESVADAVGKDKVGVRISPHGVFNDMPAYPEIDATYKYLVEQLYQFDIAYIHLLDHSVDGAPEVPLELKESIRKTFSNTLILTGGYNAENAEKHISSGLTNLVAFGRPFISNPDLVIRLQKKLPLNIKLDASTLYTPGEKGLTDYPVFAEETIGTH
jgi:N-ethylmaleimide reductase